MARTAVTPVFHARNTLVPQDAGTALDPANGHSIAGSTVSGAAMLLDIDSTFAGAKTFTIKAGAAPGAQDTVLSLNAQRGVFLLSGRDYFQANGDVLVDVQAGATGTIRAKHLAHH